MYQDMVMAEASADIQAEEYARRMSAAARLRFMEDCARIAGDSALAVEYEKAARWLEYAAGLARWAAFDALAEVEHLDWLDQRQMEEDLRRV